jgi:hypothetical protein
VTIHHFNHDIPVPHRIMNHKARRYALRLLPLAVALVVCFAMVQSGCRNWCPTCMQQFSGTQCVVLGAVAVDTLKLFDPTWLPASPGRPLPGPGETYSLQCLMFLPENTAHGVFVEYDHVANGATITALAKLFRPAAWDSTLADPNTYTVRLALRRPNNSYLEQAGIDIMVASVDSMGQNAMLRVTGSIGVIPDTLPALDSASIHAYAGSHCALIRATPITKYGAASPGAARTREVDTILAYLDGRPVARDSLFVDGRFTPMRAPSFFGNTEALSAVDIPAKAGQLFLYQALNGLEYLVVVTGIGRDASTPHYGRVALKFVLIASQDCYTCNRL